MGGMNWKDYPVETAVGAVIGLIIVVVLVLTTDPSFWANFF
jgi:hypothetical protein